MFENDRRVARRLTVLAIASAGALVLAGCSGGGSQPTDSEGPGDAVTLTIGHPFGATHLIQTEVLEPWAEEVNEATDGTVTIEIIPGGALGTGDVVYENVVSGAQDMGFSAPSYTPGRFPLTDAIELPFQFDSAVDGTEAIWELMEEVPEMAAEFDEVKLLGHWANDLGDLWTKDTQVTTMDDLAGLTLRTPGAAQVNLLAALGGTGVVIPGADVYDSLDRGVINGLMVADSGLVTLNLIELLDYGLICNCYTNTGFLAMNQAKWDSLSADQQAAIESLSGEALSIRASEAYDAAYAAALEAVDAAGIEVTELEGAELERWSEVGDKLGDEWAASAESKGLPGDQVLEILRSR